MRELIATLKKKKSEGGELMVELSAKVPASGGGGRGAIDLSFLTQSRQQTM